MNIGDASHYPAIRLRRLRKHLWSRTLVSEQQLHASDLILPLFVIEGSNKKEAVASMPGVYRYSIDNLLEQAKIAHQLSIQAVALFPNVSDKKRSLDAAEAYNPNGLVQQAIGALKQNIPNLGVITDVALDPYTSHGQDGIIDDNGYVVNDETIAVLIKQALSHAQSGADAVAPSDMMDGRIGFIRNALEGAGYVHTLIISYAAKYASCYYNPFRDAVGSQAHLATADKNTYQMDSANSNEALREVALDIQEGADAVLIKPGLLCLDIVAQTKQTFKVPTFVYHVSGEYSMLKAAVAAGFLDEKKAVREALIACRRAGADAILTYHALDMAQWLQEEKL